MPAGRPAVPVIPTPEEFEFRADKYFALCEEKKKRPTLSGLILALGLSSRQSLQEYQKRENFFDSVQRAKLRIAEVYEDNLLTHASGASFALQNFGWKGRNAVEHTSPDGSMSASTTIVVDREAIEAIRDKL